MRNYIDDPKLHNMNLPLLTLRSLRFFSLRPLRGFFFPERSGQSVSQRAQRKAQIKSMSPLFYFLIYILSFASIFISNKNSGKAEMTNPNHEIRYAAIGDSYTIGEGAREPDEAWPTLLTQSLNKDGINIRLVANPSKTGWTTKDVIEYELPEFDAVNPDFATLLIGVNDWVQGVDAVTFQNNLSFIVDHMLARLQNKKNLVLVTIPDFSVTPSGGQYAHGRDISQGLTAFNEIIKQEADKRNLQVVDIFPVSLEMKGNPELVAADGLHPSAKEYAIWEKLIYPIAKKILSRN